MSLLHLLSERISAYGSAISLFPVYLDMGFSEDARPNLDHMEAVFEAVCSSYHVEATDIGTVAHSEENRKNPCFLCTRLRRKRFFEIAETNGCNKLAFGHHKDDMIETFLINVFYGREISTMVPRQSVFKGRFHLIRPLCYAWETEVKSFAREQEFQTLQNQCPTEATSRRKFVKRLLVQLEKEYRGTKENIFKALQNVKTEYLL
jgi:tRNA 2-thiocytidine biosynthesis protein TtcA